MKQNILSVFHYVIFFWGMFLFSSPKVTEYNKSYECDYNSEAKAKQTEQVSLNNVKTTQLLDIELLFKY